MSLNASICYSAIESQPYTRTFSIEAFLANVSSYRRCHSAQDDSNGQLATAVSIITFCANWKTLSWGSIAATVECQKHPQTRLPTYGTTYNAYLHY